MSPADLNPWSKGKIIKIPVYDFLLNPREITWKGKTVLVGDYELFILLIQEWMKYNNWTKDEALDLFFEM